MNYRKLTGAFSFEGKGLHSGETCSVRLEPSDTSLTIEAEGECLPLSLLSHEGGGRGSDLIFPNGRRIRTCEHVLSALVGVGVWQAKLSVVGPEMPALDGCAAEAAETIMRNSVAAAGGPKPLSLRCPVHVGDHSRFLVALPSPTFHVTCVIDYEASAIGTQILDYGGMPEDYLKMLAPARTFALAKDIEALRAAGMALGGSLDNAILVEQNGVQTTGGLRFADEFVRHKVLDLIGDLAHVGSPLMAHVVAVRSGHVQHLQLVDRLRALRRGVE